MQKPAFFLRKIALGCCAINRLFEDAGLMPQKQASNGHNSFPLKRPEPFGNRAPLPHQEASAASAPLPPDVHRPGILQRSDWHFYCFVGDGR